MYFVAKRCVLPENCPKKQTGRNGLLEIERSHDRRRHVTLKGQGRDRSLLTAEYLGSKVQPIGNRLGRIERSHLGPTISKIAGDASR